MFSCTSSSSMHTFALTDQTKHQSIWQEDVQSVILLFCDCMPVNLCSDSDGDRLG